MPAGDTNKPNAFNVIPSEGLEGYDWQNKMICRITADTNDEYERFYKYTDFAKVFELYILKRASTI